MPDLSYHSGQQNATARTPGAGSSSFHTPREFMPYGYLMRGRSGTSIPVRDIRHIFVPYAGASQWVFQEDLLTPG